MVKKTVTSKLNLIGISTVVLLLFFSGAFAATVDVTVDGSQSDFPPLTLMRASVPGFSAETSGLIDDINYAGAARMGFINGLRNLDADNTTQTSEYCGSPLPEFYFDGQDIQTRQDTNWTSLRNRSNQQRLLLIHSLQKTPAESGSSLFTLDPGYEICSSDHNPIPIPAEFDLQASVVGEWIRNSEINVDYPSIWCGAQEPDHTLGFPKCSSYNNADKEHNVERAVHYWTPIARQIRADSWDTFVAGIQQNGSRGNSSTINGDNYLHASNYFMQYEDTLGGVTPLDFLFIQNYQAENNVNIVGNARFSLSSIESGMSFSHQDVTDRFQNTPILFNRYNYDKSNSNDKNYNTAEGLVRLLQYEEVMLDAPDFYGYTMKGSNYYNPNMLTYHIGAFMNKMPVQRRPITISQTNVHGFAGVNKLGAYVVLSNRSSSTSYDVTLDLNNLMPAGVDDWANYTLEVNKGDGAVYSTVSGVSLISTGPDDYQITGLTLAPETFATIRLDSDGVLGENHYSDYLDRNGLSQLAYSRFDIYCDRQVNTANTPQGQGRYNHRTASLCVGAETSAGIGLAGVTFRKVPAGLPLNMDFFLANLPAAGDGSTVLEVRIDYLDGDTIMDSACISPSGFVHAGASFWNSIVWDPISSPAESLQDIASDMQMSWDITSGAPAGWSSVPDADRGLKVSLLLTNAPNPANVQVFLSDWTPAPATTLSFAATDDSFSRQDQPDELKGDLTQLSVRGDATGKEKNVYLKFDVSGVTGSVQLAKLKLYADDKAPADATAHSVADTTWDEATMTWNNAPAIGASLETITNIMPLNWAEWDVTSHVTGDGLISLAVSSTDDRTVLDFHSKEFTYPPVLEVSYVDTGGGDPPTFNTDPINEIDATEDAAYSSTIAGSASDPESDPLTFSKAGGPAWLNVAANGALSGTPTNSDVGLNVFTVQVDATGGSDTATLNITVLNTNDDPSFTSDPIVEINANEDAAYSSTLADDATDPDVGDTLFFSLVTGPTWLSVASDGTLSGTPGAGDVGLNSFTVQVDDDSAAFDQATLEITVNAAGWTELIYDDFEGGLGNWVDGGLDCQLYTDGTYAPQGNNAVELRDDTDTSVMTTGNLAASAYAELKVDFSYKAVAFGVNEDFWLQISTNGGSSFTTVQSWVNGTDFQNDQVYLESVTISGYSLNNQTQIRFRCDASGNGDDVYIDEVRISGSVTGGGGNNPPTFTSDPIVEINATEDQAYSSSIADDADDPDSDPLTFSKISGPAWLVIASGGALSGTPGAGDVGLNSFTVEVDDGQGGTDQATLEITVDPAGGPGLPGQASNPSPSNNAKKVENPILSWTPGTDATSHDVYFGTDSTPDSGEFQGNQAGTSFDPGSLSGKTNYYWRIDEVNAQGTTTGIVWTFKTK